MSEDKHKYIILMRYKFISCLEKLMKVLIWYTSTTFTVYD